MEPCMVFPPSLLLCIVLFVVSTIFYFFPYFTFSYKKKVIYEGTGASSGIATERDVYFCGKSKDDVFLVRACLVLWLE